MELVISPHAPALRVQRGEGRLAPHVGQHAGRQLAEAVGLLQDAVVDALPCGRSGASLRERHALGLGQDAGEIGRAFLCKRVVLHGRGGGGRRGAGGGGGRRGRHGRWRGVPETAAAATAGGVGGTGALRAALAQQQHLLAGDPTVRGVLSRSAGGVQLLAAHGGAEVVCVGAAVLSRFSDGEEQKIGVISLKETQPMYTLMLINLKIYTH